MESFFVALKNRGLITVSGSDARDFLQGLITNDIRLLEKQESLYACLLTPQGKFLHDFFISANSAGDILIECEGGARARDLEMRLARYRLRKDVTIACEENIPVYAIFQPSSDPVIPSSVPDPRHADMGYRGFEKPGLPEKPFEEWDRRRIALCIPDGSRDLIPEKSTLDEGRIDTLHGVDYKKGCYVGQELTARMHYRGLGKKHLRTVHFKPSLRANENKRSNPESWIAASALRPSRTDEEQKIIELRSTCGDMGLALVRTA